MRVTGANTVGRSCNIPLPNLQNFQNFQNLQQLQQSAPMNFYVSNATMASQGQYALSTLNNLNSSAHSNESSFARVRVGLGLGGLLPSHLGHVGQVLQPSTTVTTAANEFASGPQQLLQPSLTGYTGINLFTDEMNQEFADLLDPQAEFNLPELLQSIQGIQIAQPQNQANQASGQAGMMPFEQSDLQLFDTQMPQMGNLSTQTAAVTSSGLFTPGAPGAPGTPDTAGPLSLQPLRYFSQNGAN